MHHSTVWRAYLAAGLCCLIGTACRPTPSSRLGLKSPHTTLHQVAFQRMDAKGKVLWVLEAKSVKMETFKRGHLKQIQGTFYHNHVPVYGLQAPEGTVDQQSHFVQLQGPIVVEDLRDRSTLHSQYLQWHPQTGELKAHTGVRLEHPHFTLTGQQFQASTPTHDARLSGQTTVRLKGRDWTVTADQITWFPQQQKLQAYSMHPTRVRLQSTAAVPNHAFPWQQAQATSITWDLAAQHLVFQEWVELTHTNPAIQLRSPRVIMDLTQQQWRSPGGIHLKHPSMTATANQGWFDSSGTLHLNNQVRVQDLPHQGSLRAQTVMWNLTTQNIKAQGNLIYQQTTPHFRLTGISAQGNLHQQTLEIQGGETVIEIVP